MRPPGRGKPETIVWIERAPGMELPPLEPGLPGWEIQKRRASHWNAKRSESGCEYFLKWFFHGIWRHPGRREWQNAAILGDLGIPSVTAMGWGRHSMGSFVVLKGSDGFPLDEWREHGLTERDLVRLAIELAPLAARLHAAGYCHKDLNVYHVLASKSGLRIIDVGRIARFTRRRWIVKDLASLAASARRERVPRSASRAFLGRYLRESGSKGERRRFLLEIERKARRYQRHNEKRDNVSSS